MYITLKLLLFLNEWLVPGSVVNLFLLVLRFDNLVISKVVLHAIHFYILNVVILHTLTRICIIIKIVVIERN